MRADPDGKLGEVHTQLPAIKVGRDFSLVDGTILARGHTLEERMAKQITLRCSRAPSRTTGRMRIRTRRSLQRHGTVAVQRGATPEEAVNILSSQSKL